MTVTEAVFETVKKIMAVEDVGRETVWGLGEDEKGLNVDAMDGVDILMGIEETLGKKVFGNWTVKLGEEMSLQGDKEKVVEFKTVGDLVDWVEEKLKGEGDNNGQ